MPQVVDLPGVGWGLQSMLQVEGRQNWIPENKGVGVSGHICPNTQITLQRTNSDWIQEHFAGYDHHIAQ